MAAVMTAHLRAMLYTLGFTQNGPVMNSIVTSMLLAGLPRNTAIHPGPKASPVEGTPDDDASVLRKVTAFIETMYGKTGPIVRKACNRALEDASRIGGFTRNHPRFCVVVALGTIVFLTPSFITLLGFAAEGPTAGSFAALWESTYGGAVPAKSLFAYFQHLSSTGGSLISLL